MVSHNRESLYGRRGFSNIWEHDEQIIKNWNKVVGGEDEVYLLGDVMLNDNEHGIKCLKQLKGRIHIILGNHCTDTRRALYKDCYNVVDVCYADVIKYNGYHFYLSHYPTLCGNIDDNGRPLKKQMINICGHTHTKDPFVDWGKGNIFHCELDAHNCTPISLNEIISMLENKIKK